ncbi:MAG TPA: UpxY family transcription antiterminator [Cyclobacteriaceae bacterium]|nr:UpxY family transcription antiterminator [Cyclobacteriaceae bacterium]
MDWYVIYTKPRNEKAVAERLLAKGIEAYCPLRKAKHRWSDRWKWVESPLFTSYCFVRLEAHDREKVFTVPGIVRYLFWLGQPAVVREVEIRQIKIWLNEFDHGAFEISPISAGDKVKIGSGSLMNQKGEIVSVSGNYACLKLEGMGLMMRVDLRMNKVERISA